MATPVLTNYDFSQNMALNLRLQVLASPPASPVTAQIYWDSTLQMAAVWNGTNFAGADATKLVGVIPVAALVTNPLARANHTGTQLSATISDLATVVQGYRLNQFAAPNAIIPLAGFTFSGMAAPTGAGQPAEYSWTLSRSLSAFAAPTANIPTAGFTFTGLPAPSGPGQPAEYSWTIGQIQAAAAGIASKPPVATVATANFVVATGGLGAVNGYTPVDGDRVLLTAQTTATENGPYNAHAGAWTRTTVDGPGPGELEPGAMWAVTGGSQAGAQYRVSNPPGAIVVGSTAIAIVLFNIATAYTPGNGIGIVSNVVSATPAPGGGILVTAAGIAVDFTKSAGKYSQNIGDGTSTSFAVTHNLNTSDIVPACRAVSGGGFVDVDMYATSANVATFTFANPPAANAYRVTILA